jgi:hypothetical protein
LLHYFFIMSSGTQSRWDSWPLSNGVAAAGGDALAKLMPAFPKPSFTFDYDADAERAALRQWRDTQPGRAIPAKDANRLLLATWNIANLCAQDRGPKDCAPCRGDFRGLIS